MVRLTPQARKSIPAYKTGLPSKRTSKGAVTGSYPMPDRKHASIAKAYAKRFATPAQQEQIDAKANAILGKKKTLVKKATKAKNQVKKAATMLKKKANVTGRKI